MKVLAFAKLDRRHKLKIQYRDQSSILRTYEIDFIIKTADRMFLLETKTDKDLNLPNTATKARAAVSWCEQASAVSLPQNYKQPQTWEYLILSESIFRQNPSLGFNALLPFCRATRDRIIAQSQNKLFS